jgi:hypothetical protein
MSDTPLPPQTDYPYAARMRVDAVSDESFAAEPRYVFGSLTERLEAAVDKLLDNDSQSQASQHLSIAPVIAVGLCAFATVDVMPLVVIEIFENFGGRPSDVLVILTLAPWGGMIAGEFIVFAFLLVWSQGSFVLRLVIHWLLAIALYCCWAAALTVVSSLENWGTESTLEATRAVLMALPVVCLAVQAPLWCLRIYGGWRLETSNRSAAPYAPAQVSLGDILLGTAIVAVSLTLWRLMFEKQESFGSEFWIGWGIAFPVIALISILTTAPLLGFIVGLKSLPLAILSLIAYWVILSLLGSAVVIYFNPSEWRESLLFFFLAILCGFSTVSIPFWLARAAGYRLRIGKS